MVTVQGHTDHIPIGSQLAVRFPTNWELSAARAGQVARHLLNLPGVNPSILSTGGMADTRPIADNTSPEGRALNRRIEIMVTPAETNDDDPMNETSP